MRGMPISGELAWAWSCSWLTVELPISKVMQWRCLVQASPSSLSSTRSCERWHAAPTCPS